MSGPKDFHGLTADEAQAKIHQIVGRVRQARAAESIEFIVGHGGSVRTAVLETLLLYDIEAHPKLGNEGVLVAMVE